MAGWGFLPLDRTEWNTKWQLNGIDKDKDALGVCKIESDVGEGDQRFMMKHYCDNKVECEIGVCCLCVIY